jgi:hypothetical protein
MLMQANTESHGVRDALKEGSVLLRPRDVTLEYHLGEAWLRKRRRPRLAPAFVRIGRMVYYERSELEAFVQSQRVEPIGQSKRSEAGVRDGQ